MTCNSNQIRSTTTIYVNSPEFTMRDDKDESVYFRIISNHFVYYYFADFDFLPLTVC